MCTTASGNPSGRYAADVVSLNRDLSFRNLARQDRGRLSSVEGERRAA